MNMTRTAWSKSDKDRTAIVGVGCFGLVILACYVLFFGAIAWFIWTLAQYIVANT